jgi:hypothetical protein
MTALAADGVPTVDVSGSVVDTEGQAAVVESARVEERETPDSEPVVTPVDVAEDGTFTVALREWGTPEQPAVATFVVFGPRGEPVVVNEEGCTEQTTPFGTLELQIPGQVPVEPVAIILDQVGIDGLCPAVTATPDRGNQAPAEQPTRTLPPTDAGDGVAPGIAGFATAALLLGGMGLLASAFVLTTRSAARPHARTVSSTRRRGSRYR